jgi:hypothetical protein
MKDNRNEIMYTNRYINSKPTMVSPKRKLQKEIRGKMVPEPKIV